ncbi:C2 family cysteine protease [Actinokineospora sp. HUAS TT18]|uniref:C2 family cysteine protease n=1 Tax=Actinokineospora sp. HUAS TT18 TaxID=3447451 RepID=UPI003F51EB90
MSGPWTWDLVLVAEPEGGHQAAGGFAAMAATAEGITHVIEKLDRVAWEGEAAEAYRAYLSELRTVVLKTMAVAEDSQHATVGATGTLDALRNPATETAEELNRFQAAVDQMNGPNNDDLDFVELTQVAVMRGQATQSLARVRGQKDEALNLLTDLVKAQEETLLALRPPRGPDASKISDPAERAAVEALSGEVNQTLDKSGDTTRARDYADKINQADNDYARRLLLLQAADDLTAEELDYLLDHLDTDALHNALATDWMPFGGGPEDTAAQRELYNKLAGKVDLDTLNGLADQLPEDYWHPNPYNDVPGLGDDLSPDGNNLSWQPLPDAGKPVTPDTIDPNDVQQRGLGDCHLQATLYSLASTPEGRQQLADNIQLNPNGTYTVTLYRNDGTPVPVVVTPDTPVQRNGAGWQSTYDGNQANWVQLYEKALAQTNAELSQQPSIESGHGQNENRGYPGLNGGFPEEDMARITGERPEKVDSPNVTDDQLRQFERDGKPVTVTILGEDAYKDPNGTNLVNNHVYSLERVDWSTNPPTAHLRNPWGSEHIAMPLNDLREHTTYMTVGK